MVNSLLKFKSLLYAIGLALIVTIVLIWRDINELSFTGVLISQIPLGILALYHFISPSYLAKLYSHRIHLSLVVLILSLIAGCYIIYDEGLFSVAPRLNADLGFFLFQFLLQGILVGVIIRVLILHLTFTIVKSADVYKAQFLLALGYVLFLVLFPVGTSHRNLIPVYIVGVGIGFFVHFISRITEHRNNQNRRFSERILFLAENSNLGTQEFNAIKLYVKQKWNRLERLLNKYESSEVLLLINLSMLYRRRSHEKALRIIETKLKDDTFQNKHFIHIHAAINQNEIFTDKGELENVDLVLKYLENALSSNENCMLSNCLLGLQFLYSKNTDDWERGENLILKAYRIYENESNPSILSLITGMSLPVTYSFVLDCYGYVMFKKGHLKLARELYFQSLHQDAYNPLPYLHLAELKSKRMELSGDEYKKRHKNWKKSSQVCLEIAKSLSNRDNKTGQNSFINYYCSQVSKSIEKGTNYE